MPVVADTSRPDWRCLIDDDGRVLARFQSGHYEGRPVAGLVETHAGVDEVADRMARELPDWRVAGQPALGEALIARGARLARHAHTHSRDLRADPAPPPGDPPPGVTIGPLDRTAHELAPVYRVAYPRGHVDWTYTGPPADYERDLDAILDGGIAGPRLDISRLALDARGKPAGVLIATDVRGDPPVGGPWVAELFRRPGDDVRGTGRALLETTLHAATLAGLATLGLTVTEGNPARRLYESLGFVRVQSSLVVVLSRDA